MHVGTHYAEEEDLYQKKELNVMWGEACPSFSRELKSKLAGFDNQDFRIAALSRLSGLMTPFHTSNNSEGVSSSFYHFGIGVVLLWPKLQLRHANSLKIFAKTFNQFVEKELNWCLIGV